MAEQYPDLKITEELRSYMAGRSDDLIRTTAVAYMLGWIQHASKTHAAECDRTDCGTCSNFTVALSLAAAFTAEHSPLPGVTDQMFDDPS